MGQKRYKVLDISTRKIFTSREIHFDEQHFPFTFLTSPTPPLFPSFSLDLFDQTSPIVTSPQVSFQSPLTSLFPPTHNSQPQSTSLSSPSTSTPVSFPSLPGFPPLPKRSGKVNTVPSYLHDYVCNNIILTNLTGACFLHPSKPTTFFSTSVSLPNQHTLLSVSHITKPHIFA